MTTAKRTRKSSGKIASHVPGRIRFKLNSTNRDAKSMDDIKNRLEALPGIDAVKLNPTCGSVTVRYSHEQHSMVGILDFLADLDVIVDSIGHLPSIGDADDDGSDRRTPEFLAAIEDMNRRLRETTRLPIDLKVALPLAFVGAGTWSILRKGLMIESVPGWLFLWFAFDMFVKLHPVKPPGSER